MKKKERPNAEEAAEQLGISLEQVFELLDGAEELPCFLCDQEGDMSGIFIPEDTPANRRRFFLKPGKENFYAYSLCTGCFEEPDQFSRVVELIAQQEALANAKPTRKDLH